MNLHLYKPFTTDAEFNIMAGNLLERCDGTWSALSMAACFYGYTLRRDAFDNLTAPWRSGFAATPAGSSAYLNNALESRWCAFKSLLPRNYHTEDETQLVSGG